MGSMLTTTSCERTMKVSADLQLDGHILKRLSMVQKIRSVHIQKKQSKGGKPGARHFSTEQNRVCLQLICQCVNLSEPEFKIYSAIL